MEETLEVLDEKCSLCGTEMLMFINEPERSQHGKWCPKCQMLGLNRNI